MVAPHRDGASLPDRLMRGDRSGCRPLVNERDKLEDEAGETACGVRTVRGRNNPGIGDHEERLTGHADQVSIPIHVAESSQSAEYMAGRI